MIPLPKGPFSCIVADPPWGFRTWIGVAARYRFRPAQPTLEQRLFAVGLARTNDV